MDNQPQEPVEQVPITLFDTVVLAVRSNDGYLWLSVSDLAVAVNVDPSTQRRRVQTNAILNQHIREFRAPTPGGIQNQLFLKLEGVGLWVMTINARRVGDRVRDRLVWLQQHLEDAVRKAFAQATGLPERSSDIEDIDELGQIDPILQGLVNQQGSLLKRQEDLARTVAELAAQLRALKPVPPADAPVMSKAQRGQIYQLVLTWATLLQQRNEGMSIGAARATCWAAFKRRFTLAEYQHLSAAQYNEAVDFIRDACRKLGGGDLPAQAGMDLEDG